MIHARQIAAALLVAALVSCGGPATVSPPPSPEISGVSPTAAPRGESIVVSGANLGSGGTLTVGGVEAAVTSWSATEVAAVVADATPSGGQEIAIATDDGAASFESLFVGVEYDGTAADLQEFLDGLEAGTAVLLQAQTYDLSGTAEPLLLDNHGLYGRGAGQTTILAPTPSGLVVLVDFGNEVAIEDLTLQTDYFIYFHGTLADSLGVEAVGAASADHPGTVRAGLERGTATIELASAAQVSAEAIASLAPHADATGGALSGSAPQQGLGELDRAALTLRTFVEAPQLTVAPSAIAYPTLTVRNVALAEVGGGGVFGVPFFTFPAVDVTLEGVTVEAPDSAVAFLSTQHIVIDDADVAAGFVTLISVSGSVSVLDSTIVSETDIELLTESGLAVTRSTVRARDGDIVMIGAVMALLGGGSLPTGGPIEIAESTIEALDGDLADLTMNGTLEIATQYAPIVLRDNVRVRSHDDTVIVTVESFIGEADVTLRGNLDMRAGVYQSEDAVNFRAAGLFLQTTGGGMPDTITLDGNVLAATSGTIAMAGGANPGNLVARDNVVTAGDDLLNGSLIAISGTPGTFTLEANELAADSIIQLVAPDLDGATARIRDNEIAAVGAGAFALLIFPSGELDVRSNLVTSEAVLVVDATGTSGTIAENDFSLSGGMLLLAGDAGTDLTLDRNTLAYEDTTDAALVLSGLGAATVTDNTFTDTGTPAAAAVALSVGTAATPVAVDASGNTFANFSRALAFADQNGAAVGIDATISNNVFDFVIDAAPKVATLTNVKDEIDARNNVWGTNAVVATVESYVTLAGDTNVQGGSILLDPITLP